MAQQIWIFGYGSLMWQPDFSYIERQPGMLRGWHRAHALTSTVAWGSVERPGLIITMLRGGDCFGMAYRIASGRWRQTNAYLRKREVAYRHVWVEVVTPKGKINALTFTANPSNSRYIGKQPLVRSALMVVQGKGLKGTSVEYLDKTISALRVLGGQPEPYLLRLQAAVHRSKTYYKNF